MEKGVLRPIRTFKKFEIYISFSEFSKTVFGENLLLRRFVRGETNVDPRKKPRIDSRNAAFERRFAV
ncbi:hypothetical protein CH375_09590 [Leptospira ellisii]|nr:hypothetical protein CH375_09590 [Leptospira ellisii]